jgi:hypothetical protein
MLIWDEFPERQQGTPLQSIHRAPRAHVNISHFAAARVGQHPEEHVTEMDNSRSKAGQGRTQSTGQGKGRIFGVPTGGLGQDAHVVQVSVQVSDLTAAEGGSCRCRGMGQVSCRTSAAFVDTVRIYNHDLSFLRVIRWVLLACLVGVCASIGSS